MPGTAALGDIQSITDAIQTSVASARGILFDSMTRTLVFIHGGDSSVPLLLRTTDDINAEISETFAISLVVPSSETGSALGTQSRVQTTIVDDEALLNSIYVDIASGGFSQDYSVGGANPTADIRARIISGRGGVGLGTGTWTGAGINSSAAAAANATDPESRSVGYANNADLPLGPYTSFLGQPVDASAVLVRYTRTGDATLDGVVNDDDVTIVGATYAPGVPNPSWALGDFDYNGFVDDDDVTLLGAFYNPSPDNNVDVGNGGFSQDYSVGGANPTADIRARILSGRGGVGLGTATWTGAGINSSAAAAANATDPESRSVGYANNAD
jgi:hypothetical protein